MMTGRSDRTKAFFNFLSLTKSIAEIIEETASYDASLLPGEIIVSPSKKNWPFDGKAFFT